MCYPLWCYHGALILKDSATEEQVEELVNRLLEACREGSYDSFTVTDNPWAIELNGPEYKGNQFEETLIEYGLNILDKSEWTCTGEDTCVFYKYGFEPGVMESTEGHWVPDDQWYPFYHREEQNV